MKAQDPIDWNNFTPHSRIQENKGKRMIPTFQPHPDLGYQWEPLNRMKQKGKQFCEDVLGTKGTRHSW